MKKKCSHVETLHVTSLHVVHHQLSELVKQAASSNQIITLAAHGQSRAVLLSLEAFEYLIGGQAYRQRGVSEGESSPSEPPWQLLPLDEFHQQFHQALVEAGYDSREKIINLVQEVRQLGLIKEKVMLLEAYFNFLAADDIRIKGHRIGIETVLYEYIFRARTPEEIAKTYTTLTLEEVYATVLYYLHNREAVDKYLEDWLEWGHQQRKAQALNPHPAAARLRKLKVEKEAKLGANGAEISNG